MGGFNGAPDLTENVRFDQNGTTASAGQEQSFRADQVVMRPPSSSAFLFPPQELTSKQSPWGDTRGSVQLDCFRHAYTRSADSMNSAAP